MNAQQLKNSILQEAIEGRLVPQDPNDEPASVLLEKIRKEKARLVKEGILKKSELKEREINIDEVPFSIPKGWVWTKIDNIAFVTKLAGFEYTKYIANNLVSKDSGIPLFKGKNVQNGTIIYEFESYIPLSLSNELKRSQINRKCLLTPYVGTIGNIGIHDREGVFHLGSNVGKIEFYNEPTTNILEEYAKYYLMSRYGYQELTKYKKATAQESISIEAIRDVFMPIPPIEEQRRIVNKISSVFAKVEEYGKAQESLDNLNEELTERLKKSILQEAIEGRLVPQDPNDEPASVLLDKIRKEKAKLVKEGKLKKKDLVETPIEEDEIPFKIPESWEWVRINDIAISQLGKTLDRGKQTGKEYPYLCSINVYWNGIDLSKVKTFLLKDDELEKYKLKRGDLLVCEGGEYGRCNIWNRDEEMYYQNALHRIRFYGGLSSFFYKYVFEIYRNTDYIIGQGQTIKHFTYESMKKILFPLPPLAEQKSIVEKLEQLMKEIDKLKV